MTTQEESRNRLVAQRLRGDSCFTCDYFVATRFFEKRIEGLCMGDRQNLPWVRSIDICDKFVGNEHTSWLTDPPDTW